MNEQDEKTMNEALGRLAAVREVVSHNQKIRTEILEEAQKKPEYISAGDRLKEAASAIVLLEDKIRALALDAHATDGNKKVHASVEVKVFKTFKIVDVARVTAWVKENLKDALVVDTKKVEQYATKIGPVDGTEVGEEARAQISSKL